MVCLQFWQRQNDLSSQRFDADAKILHNAVWERLNRYAQILQGAGGLFAASQSVEQDEFRAYVESLKLKRYYRGILGLGYVAMVAHDRRDAFTSEVRQDTEGLVPPFRIWPAGDRPDYLVVRFVEPFQENRAAFGFDIGSEPVRRAAAWAAGDSGEAFLSGKLELVRAPGKPGAILFLPIFRRGTNPVTKEERRASLQGWVYVAFVVEEMMDGVSRTSNNGLEYEIFDGIRPRPEHLLSRSDYPGPEAAAVRTTTLPDDFGRPWTVRVRAPSGVRGPGNLTIHLLAAGGFCMSLLVFGVAHSMATTGRRAVELATGMTAELRRQEQARRASEERLEMIINGSNDGVWDWDVTTGAVYFSPRWKSMLGYEDHEIENTFEAWEGLLHPDEKERALGVLQDYFGGKAPTYQLEHRLRHKDGSYRWILARGVVLRDLAGSPTRMAGSHVDLTGLKQVEQELRKANEELQRSQTQLRTTLDDLRKSHRELEKTQLELIQAAKLESVGTLAAGVAHEVKNPLQTVVMGLDYLDQRLGSVDETTRVTLIDMRDAVARANTITKELLQFSKATDFSLVPCNLEDILERSLWLIRADLSQPRVTLVKNLAGDLPQILIDASKIQQVIINLTHNALQAVGNEGVLTITTASGRLEDFLPSRSGSAAYLQPDAEVVVLRLVDTGPGIPAEDLPRIFDPFFSTKEVGLGTGLGLSVVKKIIDLHSGVIHFQNGSRGGLEVTLAFAALPEATIHADPGGPGVAS